MRSGATHLCAAPTVLLMLAESGQASPLTSPVKAFVGGAPPSPAFLHRMTRLGLEITHLYGLTETYGPLCVCARQPAWDALPEDERAALQARQGVGTVVSERLRVVDSEMRDVPADGRTLGEVVMRGNNVMLGYYRDPEATAQAFAGGWFHSGDIAVMHPDGYLELRDRSKDIIISGGENISTIEVDRPYGASGCGRGGSGRHAPRAMGRSSKGHRGHTTRRIELRRAATGVCSRPPGALQGAQEGRVSRRPSKDGHRQDSEVPAQVMSPEGNQPLSI